MGGPIDDVAPIDDVILGTVIHGTGRTVGQTKASLTPNPAFATFDALLDAVNYSNNVGRNGPVCIYSTGQTCLDADKRFWLDETGLHAHPAQAAAQAHTTINNIVSIKGRKLVERIAWRKAGKQLGQAEAIASQHATCRLGARVDAQADPSIQKANEQFAEKVRKPLDERRGFPRGLSFDTLATALEIHGAEALESQLAAPSAPPELTRPADVSLRIHESMINNFAETVLTGMRLNDDMVQRAAHGPAGTHTRATQTRPEPGAVHDRLSPGRAFAGAADHGLVRRQRTGDHAPRPGSISPASKQSSRA